MDINGTEFCPCCCDSNIEQIGFCDYYTVNLVETMKCCDCGAEWDNIFKFQTSVIRKPSEKEVMDDDALKRLGIL